MLALGIPTKGSSQDTVQHLGLRQAIDSAYTHNRDLSLAQLEEKIAKSRWKETDAVYLPQLDLSVTGLWSDNPLNVFGFKLQQQSVQQSDFDPTRLNNPAGRSDVITRLQLKQPLFNLDQVYLRQAAALQTEVFYRRTQRAREWLAFEVEQAYLRLGLAHEVVKVFRQSLQAAQSHDRFTRDRVSAGFLQESDALNARVWVTQVETGLAEAISGVRNGSDYLALLMGRPFGQVFVVDSLAYENIAEISDVPGDRSDLLATKKALEAADKMIAGLRKGYLPRLNAFASYQLNDAGLFGFGSGSYLAGVQLSWDIFRGLATKNRIVTQQLERNKLANQLDKQQTESQLELNRTKRQLADARYQIRQQGVAVESAAEALRILQDRYEQGLVNSTEVLSAQSQLSQQRLGSAQARFVYQSTAAYFRFQTQIVQP